MSQRVRLFALLGVFALLAVACGQKPGVHRGIVAGGPAGEQVVVDDDFDDFDDFEEFDEEVDPETGEVRRVRRQVEGEPTGANGGPAEEDAPAGPGDRTGITDDEIVIGVHAPVTGAAPFPAESFALGRDVYWERSGAPQVHGRSVRLVFEDDQYNPQTAVDRCRKMVEQDGAFLLIGGGGTDQIQACARWAGQAGVPDMSAGVTEVGLENLRTYFALSMTYAQQGPLLWDMITSDARLDAENVAMVYTNTPNFQDARDAFVGAMGGRELVYERRMSKNPSQTEFQQVALELSQAGAEVVYILTAPVHYVQLTARLPAGYEPWWVGVGITKGLNDVLDTGCGTSRGAMENGLFFSPFPGVDAIDQMDAAYGPAYREVNPGHDPDDLGIAFWGLNKTLHQMLEEAGREISRESFIRSTEQSSFESGVFPPVSYSPQNHFGGQSIHLLEADCDAEIYRTAATFAQGF